MKKSKALLMKEGRQRRKDAGLVPCEVWIKPEQRPKLQTFITTKLRGEYKCKPLPSLDAPLPP